MTLEELFKPFTDAIIAIPNFAEVGLFIIFALSIIPFMLIPPEPLVIPLALGVDPLEKEDFLWTIAILISTGAFISHVIVFFVAKHHLHKLGIRKKSKLAESHWFHRYGVYTMLGIPSISIFIPPLIDSTMVVLGHYRANHIKLFSFVLLGELTRAYFTGIMLIGLVG